MSIKISELPSASSVTSSDAIPIVQSGTTKKVTVGTMLPTIATSITPSSTNNEVAGAKAVYDLSKTITYTFSKVGDNTTHNAGTTWTQFTADIVTEEIEAGEYLALMSYQIRSANSTGIVKLALWGDGNYIGGTLSTVPVADNDTFNAPAFTLNLKYSTKATHTFQPKAYGNVAWKGANFSLYLIRLGDYTATRSLNLTKSENTGSLVGMGDRAEVTLEKEEEPEEITETKSAEVDKLESEEGSGDSR